MLKTALSNYLLTRNKGNLIIVEDEIKKLLKPYIDKGCFTDYDSSYYVRKDGSEVIFTIKELLKDGYEYYLIGNITKYVERYKYKYDEEQQQCNDLLKAMKYLEMLMGN